MNWFNVKWSFMTAFTGALLVFIPSLLAYLRHSFTIVEMIALYFIAFFSFFFVSYICMHLQDKRIEKEFEEKS